MASFGSRVGSMKNLKRSLSKGGAGPISFIPKDGVLVVRFLEEPEEWVNYKEVYDPTIRKGYPLPDDESMPGFDPELRASSRYLANALDVEKDRVVALQMPKTLVNQLIMRYERYGTLIDRDYELMRSGEGMDTVYAASPEAPINRKMSKYEKKDLMEVLESAYNAIFGDEIEDDEEDDAPRKSAASKKRTAAASRSRRLAKAQDEDEEEVEEDDESDEDEDEAEEDEPDFEPEDDDEEEESDDDEDDDADEDPEEEGEGEYWTEEELNALTIGELRALAKENGIDTKGLKKPAIISLIMGEEEDF